MFTEGKSLRITRMRNALFVSTGKKPVEVDLNTTPLRLSRGKGTCRGGIPEQELETRIPRHTRPTERVGMGHELVNSIGELKPDI